VGTTDCSSGGPVCQDTGNLATGTLVHWWPGNDNTDDIVGNGSGTVVGTVGYAPAHIHDGFDFTGAGWVSVPSPAAVLGTCSFSVDAWIQTSDASSQVIMQQRAGTYDGEWVLSIGFQFSGEGSYPGQVCYWDYDAGLFGLDFCSTTRVDDGQLHHVTFVRDGTVGNIYIDGSLANSQDAGTAINLLPIDMSIGFDRRDGYRSFYGIINELKIYNGALSGAQVAAPP
jgi:hypothetical protein